MPKVSDERFPIESESTTSTEVVFFWKDMITSLLALKQSQTQTFTVDGKRIPITVVTAGPNWVTKVDETHIQLGFGDIKNLSKPEIGHIKKAGLDKRLRFLRSFRLGDLSSLGDLGIGSEIKVENIFTPGDVIRVQGTSKGKGFASVIKRHHFKGGPRSHGQSDRERAPGSIGQTTTPGRVYKGKRMAGRMGSDTITVRNLTVFAVDPTTQTLTIKGLVPGGKNGLLIISKEHT